MAALIEPHIPALRRFAWALLRDTTAADDLVQDCLERAIARWHLRRQDADAKAWLFAILHNLFRMGRRSASRRGQAMPLDEEGWMVADPTAEHVAEHRLIWRDALLALDALAEEQRVVLLLVGVEDFSYEAAAQLTGVPVGTVMSRLSRGRERLRRLIAGDSAPDTGKPQLRRVK
ncbi:RNA polymerase sigma factor [Paeniroseomonas aquatica]|uniref:Sigma-70 family RNA polymerase sigma factor n=1 Tax=Paeniroseomonas aquatica TaxID=373043 RepID=A0ABT8A4J5_9PROT|nr:sigma-70 family RNA polymerase sigma factor [Paeniroseomonas aquatica]MDN3564621.1 sigma-70 family RNA polymerase sigma factor [Paeniroseomonas aquatica]